MGTPAAAVAAGCHLPREATGGDTGTAGASAMQRAVEYCRRDTRQAGSPTCGKGRAVEGVVWRWDRCPQPSYFFCETARQQRSRHPQTGDVPESRTPDAGRIVAHRRHLGQQRCLSTALNKGGVGVQQGWLRVPCGLWPLPRPRVCWGVGGGQPWIVWAGPPTNAHDWHKYICQTRCSLPRRLGAGPAGPSTTGAGATVSKVHRSA